MLPPVDLPVEVFSQELWAPHQVFEAENVSDPYRENVERILPLTASINDQFPRLSTNGDGSNISHIFVGHGAGTDEAVALRLVTVDLLDLGTTFGDKVLDRSEVLNLFHYKSGRFSAWLDGRSRHHGCCCCHEGDGSVEVHDDGESLGDRRCLC